MLVIHLASAWAWIGIDVVLATCWCSPCCSPTTPIRPRCPVRRSIENITEWFTDRGGVNDSALLAPTGDSTYVFVNHVRLPTSPVRFMLRLATPSFRTYVAANLKVNDIGNAPVVCRTA